MHAYLYMEVKDMESMLKHFPLSILCYIHSENAAHRQIKNSPSLVSPLAGARAWPGLYELLLRRLRSNDAGLLSVSSASLSHCLCKALRKIFFKNRVNFYHSSVIGPSLLPMIVFQSSSALPQMLWYIVVAHWSRASLNWV